MTKRTKMRAALAMLIAAVLAGGYLIATKEGTAAEETADEAGFAAFH